MNPKTNKMKTATELLQVPCIRDVMADKRTTIFSQQWRFTDNQILVKNEPSALQRQYCPMTPNYENNQRQSCSSFRELTMEKKNRINNQSLITISMHLPWHDSSGAFIKDYNMPYCGKYFNHIDKYISTTTLTTFSSVHLIRTPCLFSSSHKFTLKTDAYATIL